MRATSRNIKLVLKVLDAERKGNAQKTLDVLHSQYSMTWVYRAKDGRLFPRTGKNVRKELEDVYPIKGRKYDIKHIAEGKNIVMIEMIESYPDPKTGKVYQTPEVIVIEVKNGKIRRGRHYCDPRLSYLFLKKKELEKIFK